jgi:hypothetical protein
MDETTIGLVVGLSAQFVLFIAAIFFKTPANASVFEYLTKLVLGIEQFEGITPVALPPVPSP